LDNNKYDTNDDVSEPLIFISSILFLIECPLLEMMSKGFIMALKNEFDNISFSEQTWPLRSRLNWCILMTFIKTALFHIPSFILITTSIFLVDDNKTSDKQFYTCMLIAFIFSIVFMLVTGFFVETRMYGIVLF